MRDDDLSSRFDVTALGELVIDMIPAGRSGADALYAARPGGAPGNVAAGIAGLGLRAAMVSKVGPGRLGELLIETLAGAGVDTRAILRAGVETTALAIVSLDASGERDFALYREGCADASLAAGEIDRAVIRGSRLLHVGSLSLGTPVSAEAQRFAIALAREAGALISADPNLRPAVWRDREAMLATGREAVASADIVKISEEELAALSGIEERGAAVRALWHPRLKVMAVTSGAGGADLFTAGSHVTVPGFAVDVVDTVGCGDAFTASLLAGLLASDLSRLDAAMLAGDRPPRLRGRSGDGDGLRRDGRDAARCCDRRIACHKPGGFMTDGRRLRIGVLGAGQIAQAAHFESCVKAQNAELYAICDVAEDLLARMAVMHQPRQTFTDYDAMLGDPDLEAVIIATSDPFHVEASLKALAAGKHVLCEKPMAMSVEEAERVRAAVAETDLVFHVGHMKRYDGGIEAARDFIDNEMGDLIALKAWYCDSTHRYVMTDAVQPTIVQSARSRRPSGDPKADRQRYLMLAHGSHLVDTARFLFGNIETVHARYSERSGIRCWFVDVGFANGALGHLDLTVAVRMDWHEGFQAYGENGSIVAKTFNPWYFKSSEVDIFRERDATSYRPLAADGHFYRRQVEGFADAVLTGGPARGATAEDGVASVRAMVAIARSVREGRPVALAEATGAV